MNNYLKLLKFLKGHKKLFTWAIVTMFLSSFFEVFQFSLLVPIMDRVVNDRQIIVPNKLPDWIMNIIAFLNGLDGKSMLPPFVIGFFIILVIKNFLVFVYPLGAFFMFGFYKKILQKI